MKIYGSFLLIYVLAREATVLGGKKYRRLSKKEEKHLDNPMDTMKEGSQHSKEPIRSEKSAKPSDSENSLEVITKKRRRTKTRNSEQVSDDYFFMEGKRKGRNTATYAHTQELVNLQRERVVGIWKLNSTMSKHIKQFSGKWKLH